MAWGPIFGLHWYNTSLNTSSSLIFLDLCYSYTTIYRKKPVLFFATFMFCYKAPRKITQLAKRTQVVELQIGGVSAHLDLISRAMQGLVGL